MRDILEFLIGILAKGNYYKILGVYIYVYIYMLHESFLNFCLPYSP